MRVLKLSARELAYVDGISPDILHILPTSLRKILLVLYNKIFTDHPYPKIWEEQLLLPHPKKGHTPSDPKLRGLTIGPALNRGYDSIVDTRFREWYIPNKEQAAYKEWQGCPRSKNGNENSLISYRN